MKAQHKRPDEDFHQGNAVGAPMDFFAPVASGERLHPNFRTLSDAERYSPARGLVAAMMPFYEDMASSRKTQSSTYSTDTPRPPSPVGYRPRIKAYTRNLTSAIQPKDRSHTQAQIENTSNTVTN
jgi:hypothetical protein